MSKTHTGDTLVRMLDDSLHEFDRLMVKTLEEISAHAALARDYDTLLARHQSLRLAGAGFVGEAAMALKDLRQAAA